MLVHIQIEQQEVASLLKSTHEMVQSSRTAIAESLDIVAKTAERVLATQKKLEQIDLEIERLRSRGPLVITDEGKLT